MGDIYDERPNVSEDPYLSDEGRVLADNICSHLWDAIQELQGAIDALSKIGGMGTELYIKRLNKLIEKYQGIIKVIRGILL